MTFFAAEVLTLLLTKGAVWPLETFVLNGFDRYATVAAGPSQADPPRSATYSLPIDNGLLGLLGTPSYTPFIRRLTTDDYA